MILFEIVFFIEKEVSFSEEGGVYFIEAVVIVGIFEVVFVLVLF